MTARPDDPVDPAGSTPARVVGILATDVVGSTRLDRANPGVTVLDLVDERVAAVVDQVGGRLVSHRSGGDSHLAVFPRHAAMAAAAALLADTDQILASACSSVELRIGLHAGELRDGDGEWHGAALAVAERVRDAAGPGQVLATPAALSLIAGCPGVAGVDVQPVAHLSRASGEGALPLHEVRLTSITAPALGNATPHPPDDERHGRISPTARRLVDQASRAGHDVELRAVARRLGLDDEEAFDALEQALRAGLVEEGPRVGWYRFSRGGPPSRADR